MNLFAIASAAPSPQSSDVIGPGWYDSSRELLHGLEVREGLPADAELREWISAWFPAVASSAWASRSASTPFERACCHPARRSLRRVANRAPGPP